MLDPTHLWWNDLETTGLEPHKGAKIIEVAYRLTDMELNTLFSYEKVLHFSNSEAAVLAQSDPFCFDMHTSNGLLAECAQSDATSEQVETEILQFFAKGIKDFGIDSPEQLLMAGSSIHFDRKWHEWEMPRMSDVLHYRLFDVSSMYPLLGMLNLSVESLPKVHRAMADIDRSIGELKNIMFALRNR